MSVRLLSFLLFLCSGVYAAPPVQLGRTSYGNQSNSSGTGGSAVPGGSPTQIQYNNGGTFDGISGSAVDAAGNVSLTTILSAARIFGDVADLVGTPAFTWAGDPNSGMYNAAADTLGFVTNGIERSRLSTSSGITTLNWLIGASQIGQTPSGTLHVSGTSLLTGNVSLTTGYVHLGSPTTLPTCNAANKGNVFMNTTTNCLNYCDGTAIRQVTSVAGSCT